MKKYTKYFLALMASIGMSACEQDDLSPSKVTDVSWYTSQFRKDVWNVGVNEHITFMDLSQNAKSHLWEIDNTTNFLSEDFNEEDSLHHYILEDAGNSSTETTIHVLFNEPGLKNVRLYNTFPDSVTFKGNDTLPAVFDANTNLWVIDTTFVIDVYDTLDAKLEVYINDELQIPNADARKSDTLTFEAGTSVRFVDVTEQGRPNATTWAIEGAKPSTSNERDITVLYASEGVYTASMTTARTGTQIPNASKWMPVPFVFNVIESTMPFLATNIAQEQEDESILINLNMECSDFVGQEGSFKVFVENEGFAQEIAVQNAKVFADDRTQLQLTLSAPIYNSDKIKVAYSGVGIKNASGKSLSAFENIAVKMHSVNLLDEAIFGFEKEQENWTFLDWAWEPSHTISDKQVYQGDYSLLLEAVSGDAYYYNNVTIPQTEAGKKYAFGYKMWIDPSTTATNFLITLNETWTRPEQWISDLAREEWVDGQVLIEGTGGNTTLIFSLLGFDSGAAWGGGVLRMYLDQITLSEVEERP